MSQAAGEPLAGTAAPGSAYVFITWPKPAWAHDALQARGFPEGAARLLSNLNARAGVVTRLIHRAGEGRGNTCDLLIFPQSLHVRAVPVDGLEAVLREGFETGRWPDAVRLQPGETHIFCCTHGTHDRCCAKFGFAAWRELRAAAERSGRDISVWESSHLGGDRFAANAAVFPQGHMYGRLPAGNPDEFLRRIVQGQPDPRYYRGSVFLDPLEQVAEARGWQWCADHGWSGPVLVQTERRTADEGQVFVSIKDRKFGCCTGLRLTCRAEARSVFSTCVELDACEQKSVRRWSVTSVDSVYERAEPALPVRV
ncbi:MAG: sucrase ferredoxin [Alphaproteobacteria bacterium]